MVKAVQLSLKQALVGLLKYSAVLKECRFRRRGDGGKKQAERNVGGIDKKRGLSKEGPKRDVCGPLSLARDNNFVDPREPAERCCRQASRTRIRSRTQTTSAYVL